MLDKGGMACRSWRTELSRNLISLQCSIVYYSIVYYLSDHAAGIAKLLSIDCSGSTHSTKGNITVEHYLPVMAGHTAPKLTMFPVPPG